MHCLCEIASLLSLFPNIIIENTYNLTWHQTSYLTFRTLNGGVGTVGVFWSQWATTIDPCTVKRVIKTTFVSPQSKSVALRRIINGQIYFFLLLVLNGNSSLSHTFHHKTDSFWSTHSWFRLLLFKPLMLSDLFGCQNFSICAGLIAPPDDYSLKIKTGFVHVRSGSITNLWWQHETQGLKTDGREFWQCYSTHIFGLFKGVSWSKIDGPMELKSQMFE